MYLFDDQDAETCNKNVINDFTEYFNTTYSGVCMEGQNYLQSCSFPWVSVKLCMVAAL